MILKFLNTKTDFHKFILQLIKLSQNMIDHIMIIKKSCFHHDQILNGYIMYMNLKSVLMIQINCNNKNDPLIK